MACVAELDGKHAGARGGASFFGVTGVRLTMVCDGL